MPAWIKNQFNTPERARAALCLVSVAGGAAGFALVLVGVILAR